ncbi:MAG TPA: DUF4833 domain-containing protein, partial [Segetibacter sp.]
MYKTRLLILALLPLIIAVSASAQNDFPVPAGNPNLLFYLQRTTNLNTIVCELNYKDGVVDPEEPVNVHWIRYSEQGQKEELSLIQKKLAYGVKATLVSKDKYKLLFAACKKHPLYLVKNADNKYNVFATINERQAILNRIFVKINGGSFWSPNVEFIEMKGIDLITGK